VALRRQGPSVLLGVVLHNALDLLGGYWGGRMLGFEPATCRTLAFEVGMQNSGLAATLARSYISPVAALPSAVSSVWHNLSGSLLAGIWNRRTRDLSHCIRRSCSAGSASTADAERDERGFPVKAATPPACRTMQPVGLCSLGRWRRGGDRVHPHCTRLGAADRC